MSFQELELIAIVVHMNIRFATAANIWNDLPADIILQGELSDWCTVLKDIQRFVCS